MTQRCPTTVPSSSVPPLLWLMRITGVCRVHVDKISVFISSFRDYQGLRTKKISVLADITLEL